MMWKTAKLVLVRKNGKPLSEPSTYRPLCMINTAGKLLEKIVEARIRDFLEKHELLSSNQYGFRKGRSTIDAILKLKEIVDSGWGKNTRVGMVTLDSKNAFNSAPWWKHSAPNPITASSLA